MCRARLQGGEGAGHNTGEGAGHNTAEATMSRRLGGVLGQRRRCPPEGLRNRSPFPGGCSWASSPARPSPSPSPQWLPG